MGLRKCFYQIYPLGFCGAPFENDGVLEHRILKVNDWIPHIKNLAPTPSIFPGLWSLTHTVTIPGDYTKIDTRLGTNEDFATVCDNLHKEGIKVVLDGVFNHVGRGFWAFQDVLEKNGIPRTKTGSTSVLTATQTITTVCGMRAGKVTTIWSN